jgi:aromatic ring-cleaving dioxygenase
MQSIDIIEDWHVHVYYDTSTKPTAEAVCGEVEAHLPGLTVGRMHDGPVGPHPEGSFQVLIPNERFAETAAWFSLNRQGLTVLLHPNTTDDLKDHRDYPIWFGTAPKLNYEMFDK